MPFADLTNYLELRGLRRHIYFPTVPEVLSSKWASLGSNQSVLRAVFPWVLSGRIHFLAFSQLRGFTTFFGSHPFPSNLMTDLCLTSVSSALSSHLLLWLWPSCHLLSLIRTLVITPGPPQSPGTISHLKILNAIKSSKSVLPCKAESED